MQRRPSGPRIEDTPRPALRIVGRPLVDDGRGGLEIADPVVVSIASGRIRGFESWAGRPSARRAEDDPDLVLLPGLVDSHVHLIATAADAVGLDLGLDPPRDLRDLLVRLTAEDARLPAGSWLRASGFEETWLAERRPPTRDEIDRAVPDRPVRVRHATRHGSLLNSIAIRLLGDRIASPRGGSAGGPDGLLVGCEPGITEAIGPADAEGVRTALAGVSRALASRGVVSVDDVTGSNDAVRVGYLARAVRDGLVRQSLRVFVGDADDVESSHAASEGRIEVAGVKLFAHDADEARSAPFVGAVRRARRAGVTIAVHAVEPDVVDAVLDVLAEAPPRSADGSARGVPGDPGPDRIEHASLCPPELMARLARAGVAVVTQPAFLVARGEKYRAEVEEALWPWLYPLRSLRGAGVLVAGGSDAPVVPFDPRLGLRGATERRTAAGHPIAVGERLANGAALDLFVGAARRLRGRGASGGWLEVGAPADLAILEGDPSRGAWEALQARSIVVGGRLVDPLLGSRARGGHRGAPAGGAEPGRAGAAGVDRDATGGAWRGAR